MKALHCFSILLVAFAAAHTAVGMSSVPLDFNASAAGGTTNDTSVVPSIISSYKNAIGISVNPDVQTREPAVRPGTTPVNGPIAALFAGKSGVELAGIAAAAAKANPAQARDIAAAAIQRNIAAGGGSDIDLEIVKQLLAALGTSLSPETAANIIGLGTDRVSPENMSAAVKELRNSYLGQFPEEQMAEAALNFDSELVVMKIVTAMNLGPDVFAALNSPQQIPEIDTNPFFDGDQGIGNLGAQPGGGGGGGGGGSSPDPTPTPAPVDPNPPVS
jgi:hypothetical protein